MYTMFSAGIGRVVYGLSAERLYGVFNQYGDWPRINLTSREAASYMSSPMKVEGPFLEDEAEVIVHKALQAFAARGTLKSKEGK
jgi:tRNA(Arg) A34 adenosine deaminase TadA